MKKWLVFLFAAAFLFRLVGLDQSLWLDEAISANVAMQKGFGEIIRDFSHRFSSSFILPYAQGMGVYFWFI